MNTQEFHKLYPLNIFSEEQLEILKSRGITTIEDFCAVIAIEGGKQSMMALLKIDEHELDHIMLELFNQLSPEVREKIQNQHLTLIMNFQTFFLIGR